MNAQVTTNATPAQVASSITRAWIGFFIAISLVGFVLSLVIGSIFSLLAQSMSGNPLLMRLSIWVVSVAINAPLSFLLFHWAVRNKVLPAVLDWNAGGSA
jgi:hypothetical protein